MNPLLARSTGAAPPGTPDAGTSGTVVIVRGGDGYVYVNCHFSAPVSVSSAAAYMPAPPVPPLLVSATTRFWIRPLTMVGPIATTRPVPRSTAAVVAGCAYSQIRRGE